MGTEYASIRTEDDPEDNGIWHLKMMWNRNRGNKSKYYFYIKRKSKANIIFISYANQKQILFSSHTQNKSKYYFYLIRKSKANIIFISYAKQEQILFSSQTQIKSKFQVTQKQ